MRAHSNPPPGVSESTIAPELNVARATRALAHHRWLDSRTRKNHQKNVHLTVLPPNATPNNRDVLWLQERAAGRK